MKRVMKNGRWLSRRETRDHFAVINRAYSETCEALSWVVYESLGIPYEIFDFSFGPLGLPMI